MSTVITALSQLLHASYVSVPPDDEVRDAWRGSVVAARREHDAMIRRIATLEAERDALNPVCERLLARIAALEAALRKCRNLTHLQRASPSTVRAVGERVAAIVNAALAEPVGDGS